jgi:hypothetical protein
MAQIDPNIALGFRMPQIQDPVAATGRVQEIGVNALKMQELQRGLQEEEQIRNYLAGADLAKPETRAGLAKFGKAGLATGKLLAEQEKAGLETRKLGNEITKQQLEQSRERTSDLAFNPSDSNIRAYLEDSIIRKEMTPQQAEGLFAQVANMPIDQRRQTFLQLGANAAKRLEQMTISAAQQQTADVTKRGQDISASTQRRGQDKPVFSPDFGGFVVPPSANAPQGSFIPVTGPTGAPLESSKPLTEGQAKGVGFALRAREADQVLNTIGKKGEVQPGLIKRTLESTPFIGEGLGTMANVTQSAAQQQVEQAQRNFVNAVLRQESGAVINEDEFNNAKKQYFPQPGDSDKVIKQKEQARKTTIKALETQAGPGLRRAGGGKAEDPLGIR